MTSQSRNKIYLGLALAIAIIFVLQRQRLIDQPVASPPTFWNVRSIDTVKVSRDLSRQIASGITSSAVIDQEVSAIASTGANYVAVGTPYDEEFVPVLKLWVAAARKNNLHVWFRGNFSGWEGWFNYPKLTRQQHLDLSSKFIQAHPELFEDGDIFTSCPECENGGPGDPRQTGDVTGFRNFLVAENTAVYKAFTKINKAVQTNYYSMNLDVTNVVMDKYTVAALDGVITIDHYTTTSDKFKQDLDSLTKKTGAKVVLGEFGAPIPDLNGNLTGNQQAQFIGQELDYLARNKNVIGLNYWTATGGSTEIWDDKFNPYPIFDVIKSYFTPNLITGFVADELSRPILGAKIESAYKSTQTDQYGKFVMPVVPSQNPTLKISASGFNDQTIDLAATDKTVTLKRTQQSPWFRFLKFFKVPGF